MLIRCDFVQKQMHLNRCRPKCMRCSSSSIEYNNKQQIMVTIPVEFSWASGVRTNLSLWTVFRTSFSKKVWDWISGYLREESRAYIQEDIQPDNQEHIQPDNQEHIYSRWYWRGYSRGYPRFKSIFKIQEDIQEDDQEDNQEDDQKQILKKMLKIK